MSPHLQSLRVDCDAIRKGGYRIEVEQTRHPNMPNVTAAVEEYQALTISKPRGCLSRIARKHHTTPSSILGRINRKKK